MQLIFVYNATTNPVALLGDFIAELIPQQETKCNLCSITYSLVFKKKEWSKFIKQLPVESTFMLKDTFLKKFEVTEEVTFPAVFLKKEEALKEIISAKEINGVNNIEELKSLVLEALNKQS